MGMEARTRGGRGGFGCLAILRAGLGALATAAIMLLPVGVVAAVLWWLERERQQADRRNAPQREGG